jgi:hypothetical protein
LILLSGTTIIRPKTDFKGNATPFILKENIMTTGTILLIILIVLLIGAAPAWPYSRGWGYGPSGGLGALLIVLLILVLMGVI